MKKKILSWLLIGVLCAGCLSTDLQVKAETVGEIQLFDEPEAYYMQYKGEPSVYGYQDYEWVDENGNVVEIQETRQEVNLLFDDIVESVNLPSAYDMRDVDGTNYVPAIRNQGSFGTCWAHAALASMETNMIKKGFADTEVDYAERHLAYFAHTPNEALGDGAESISGSYGKYGGGNAQQAIGQLAGWYGAANETDFPYENCSASDSIAEANRKVSVAHLTEANELTDASDIKAAIMANGAVQGSYYSASSDGEYIYKTGMTGTNHAISIIGWDDTLDKSNFSYNDNSPMTDGAWLVRNSWGTNWGNAGYCWISYEDSTLSSFWSFEAEPADARDYIYQYDGAGYKGYLSSQGGEMHVVNAYKAVTNQILREIGFYTLKEDSYEINIYLDTEEIYPNSATLYYVMPETPYMTITGQVEHGGYHTVDIPESIHIAEGERFLVELSTGSTFVMCEIGSEYSSSKNESYYVTASTSVGGKKTYLWTDCAENTNYKNFCIKVIADNQEESVENIAKTMKETDLKLEYSAEEVNTQEMLESKLPETVSVITAAGEEAEADVLWETNDSFLATGKTYHYTGTLQSNVSVYVPEDFDTVSLTITVEPVTVTNPVFEPIGVLMQEGITTVGVNDFEEGVFPLNGEVAVGENSKVSYSIVWDEKQTIDMSAIGASVDFRGTISYTDAKAWMTLPENLTVIRRVSVAEPPYYQVTLPEGVGYRAVSAEDCVAEKVYEGRDYSFVLNEAEGYDLSAVIVKIDGIETILANGKYTIPNVVQDISHITVENVKLKNTLFKVEGTQENTYSITPIAPATGIKRLGDAQYQTSLVINEASDVKIVLQDAHGIESAEAVVSIQEEKCIHANTEIRNASAAAVGVAGYTGDVYCIACGECIEYGEIIAALEKPADTPREDIGDNPGSDDGEEPSDNPESGNNPSDSTESGSNPSDNAEKNTENAQPEYPVVGEELKLANDCYKVTNADSVYGTVEYTGTTGKSKTIKIPDTITVDGIVYKVTSISTNALKNNKKITKVIIGNNVKTIGIRAFYGCKKLTSVTIGKSVIRIGKEAFCNCKKLAKIQIKSAVLQSVGKNALKNIKNSAQIKVPKKKLAAYKKLLKGKGQGKEVKIKK
ncbi:MAG: leucine-rich repeat protein [Lachnospiraceae bacterium]|nr:leucine-rich repeat protein [Lachnospiraceae bacterium]